MKKIIQITTFIFVLTFSCSSCYSYIYSVGNGSQTGVEIKEKNHYLILGLVPIHISDPVKMAGNSEDYDVIIEHSFFDGLLNAITFGIYKPTTTRVIK